MSEINRRGLLAGTAALGALPLGRARAQAANTIRIGVLNDQSGPYRDITGPYGVQCTLQAVAEFGSRGFNVEVINADHQNRPDVGVNIARQWYDQGVDLIEPPLMERTAFSALFEFGGDLRTMPAQGNMAAAIGNAEDFARAVYARLTAEDA